MFHLKMGLIDGGKLNFDVKKEIYAKIYFRITIWL